MKHNRHGEIILIGAGPASISAALQLHRSGLDILVISPEVGGCVGYARKLENLAGFPAGITGREFREGLRRQMTSLRIPRLEETVTHLDFKKGRFHIRTDESLVTSHTLIVGSGTLPIRLGIPGEKEALPGGRIVHHPEELKTLAPERVVIVGGGDVACDSALTLADQGVRVRMVIRGERMRALESLAKQVTASPGISVEYSLLPSRILPGTSGINLECRSRAKHIHYTTDAVLVAIGRRVNLDFLSPNFPFKTTSPEHRFFLVGDAAHPRHRQTAMALGDGMRAAMEISTPIRGESDAF